MAHPAVRCRLSELPADHRSRSVGAAAVGRGAAGSGVGSGSLSAADGAPRQHHQRRTARERLRLPTLHPRLAGRPRTVCVQGPGGGLGHSGDLPLPAVAVVPAQGETGGGGGGDELYDSVQVPLHD